MRITVFTPTYNRGYVINNLYQSLLRQSFKDFEWIVIDDGSIDDTENFFGSINNAPFSIMYTKVENGGKHKAINKGVNLAKGDLFFIVDSDDYLTDDALSLIDKIERTIPNANKSEFAGVCGLRGYSLSKMVGSSFSGDVLDCTSLERDKHCISGDKAEVYYTSVLKEYPFPEFENENFLTECVVWDKIAYHGLKLRYFNNIIYICQYLPDGLTAHEKELFIKNPKGYGLYLSQNIKFGKLTGLKKWNVIFQYYNRYRNSMRFAEIAENLQYPASCLWFRLLGMKVFYRIYDK